MHVKARPLGKPVPDCGRFVSAVVIHDDMNIEVRRHIGFDVVQKRTKFIRAMTAVQLADHAVGFNSNAANSDVVPLRL